MLYMRRVSFLFSPNLSLLRLYFQLFNIATGFEKIAGY